MSSQSDNELQPIVRVQAADFNLAGEMARLTAGRHDIGAVVTFTGLCRDEQAKLSALEIEHYPTMAETEITRICQEATKRWPLTGLVAIHRFGLIRPGENIVGVIAAASHRQAAFDGANFVMDYLKTLAPFWKKEHFADGTSGCWVSAKDSDDSAQKRWSD